VTAATATAYAFTIRDVLHIPRRALDTATEQVAMLILELCETESEAETLTAAILAESWGRFSLPEFRRRVERMAGRAPEVPDVALDTFDPTGPFYEKEFQYLLDYAKKHKLTIEYKGNQYADIHAAAAEIIAASRLRFDKLKPAQISTLLSHARAERQAVYTAYAKVHSRDRDRYYAAAPTDADIEEWALHRLYLESVGILETILGNPPTGKVSGRA